MILNGYENNYINVIKMGLKRSLILSDLTHATEFLKMGKFC